MGLKASGRLTFGHEDREVKPHSQTDRDLWILAILFAEYDNATTADVLTFRNSTSYPYRIDLFNSLKFI